MHMDDRIRLRKRNTKGVSEHVVENVFCTETLGVQAERSGFNSGGQIIVRVPDAVTMAFDCGDQICREGSSTWYTVVEIRDNRREGSGLSHRKIVGRR